MQYVMGRAGRAGFFPREVHVSEVIKAQFAYFEAIGAVSEVADPARELEADLAATDLPNEPQPNN